MARARSRSSSERHRNCAWISPPRHLRAAAVSTPSGAPPVPITACTPVPETATELPAVRAPSEVSLMRAPVGGTSSLRAAGGGRRPGAAQGGPLQRVDRNVHRQSGVRVAHLLADVEHRRLVALSLTDDD